ncbi:MAG: c-type cytochrome biogenesis protein CcsB [Christensenellales bacterium]|jgi:cytochrome c-type biogenesis protein CcsB
MLNILFFAALIALFAATVAEFVGLAFKKEGVKKAAWFASLVSFALLTAYVISRGVEAGRLPLANQFEFAAGFAWGVALLHIVLRLWLKQDWISAVSLPAAFLILSYAALLPREINELMPSLKSAWFGLHIGTAVFSYASFAIAGGVGIRYLSLHKKVRDEGSEQLKQLDYIAYRLIAFGFLMLTVVILSGAIWAEQAWSQFWSWDPKETWALITWIIYAIYLHQRLRKGWKGRRMAVFAIVAVACVLFTFIGVNQLLPGQHSYA